MSDGRVSISSSFTTSAPTGAGASQASTQQAIAPSFAYADGSGLGQAKRTKTLTDVALAASGTVEYDIATFTSGRDIYGTAFANTKLKSITIYNKSTDATAILAVGGAASNAFDAVFDAADNKIKVQAPGALSLISHSAAGYTIDSTHKQLLITNLSGTAAATFDIQMLFGEA